MLYGYTVDEGLVRFYQAVAFTTTFHQPSDEWGLIDHGLRCPFSIRGKALQVVFSERLGVRQVLIN